MAFCSQCGKSVGPADAFCGGCGAKQPVGVRPPAKPFLENVSPRGASMACYIPWVGWIASIIVLATDRFRGDGNVRFHAFQGLYLFVAWLIFETVVEPFFRWGPGSLRLDKWIELALLCASIFMVIKASQEQRYSLPIIGELAEKSASEI